ncbi:MAG: accessory factor UbiK family protein [Halieaceae bacterium]|jgi:BMFP domain-containing protein YqiC|nr:accessory factor UbiK family protein [Halieaceae bacterium]
MALKPPPIGDVIRQVSDLLGDSPLKTEADRNARALLQSALRRLDMVSREEFDAQAEILARTRARVEELEAQLESLSTELEQG